MGLARHLCVVLAIAGGACSPAEVQPRAERAAVATRVELGSWKGEGNTTLGFVSETGSFRISWTAQNVDNAKPGSFMLTLRSGISGRTLKVIADHHSAGGGSVEFGDDPRLYEFLVESSGIKWAISVDETLAPKK
jgi:hypothetical protein